MSFRVTLSEAEEESKNPFSPVWGSGFLHALRLVGMTFLICGMILMLQETASGMVLYAFSRQKLFMMLFHCVVRLPAVAASAERVRA